MEHTFPRTKTPPDHTARSMRSKVKKPMSRPLIDEKGTAQKYFTVYVALAETAPASVTV